MKIAICALIILLIPKFLFAGPPAFDLNGKKFNQGEVIIIQRADKSAGVFSISFLGRKHNSVLFDKKQTVFLGIHYQLRPGMHSITASFEFPAGTVITESYSITIREKFPKLKYAPPKRTEKDQKRINQEQGNKQSAIREMDLLVNSMAPFSWPVNPIKVNASFGEKRCRDRYLWKKFNCRYHLGTDYRAAFDKYHSLPVLVHAVNGGVVAFTGEHAIDGRVVIIDHGNGLSSEYLHLSKILVKKGEAIDCGQKIGIAGKTGSTNAVHLHLTIKMDYGKTIIDPHEFLKKTVR